MAVFTKRALLLAVCLVAMPNKQGNALAATHDSALIVDNEGCHFSPEITRVLNALPQYSDMQMHTERLAARYPFENLHGVGIVENWDAEWSEVRLYFREDLPSLKAALGRIGLHVDRVGHVAVPAIAQDDSALSVEVGVNKRGHFADARSYLACGSV